MIQNAKLWPEPPGDFERSIEEALMNSSTSSRSSFAHGDWQDAVKGGRGMAAWILRPLARFLDLHSICQLGYFQFKCGHEQPTRRNSAKTMNKWIYRFLSTLLLASGCMAANGQTFLSQGLVLYYPLDGDATDRVGSNHGVLTGVEPAENRFGQAGKALAFSEVGDFVRTSGTQGLPSGTQNFTVSFWLMLTAVPAPENDPHQVVFANGALNQFQLNLAPFENSEARVRVYLGGDPAADLETIPVSWTEDQWYSLQLTREGNTLRLYRDGALLSESQTQRGNNSLTPLDIGYRSSNKSHQFYGRLDDIRIYNRALSSGEISQLYAFESAPSVPLEIELASVRLKWPSEAGAVYEIQYSSAFEDWTLLKTVGGTGEMLEYIDEIGGVKRFYRVIKK